MIKIFSAFAAASITGLTIQGCGKHSNDESEVTTSACMKTVCMHTLVTEAKNANAKIVGDNLKVSDFAKPIANFSEQVARNVKAVKTKPTENSDDYKNVLKVAHVYHGVDSMNSHFEESLSSTSDAKAHTQKLKKKLKNISGNYLARCEGKFCI